MIIYRPHTSTLGESLEYAKEFNSEEEMKEYIFNEWKPYGMPFNVEDIVIDHDVQKDDPRCGWHDTMYVCVKRMGNKVFDTPQCIGMCATNYDRMEN